jgi:hypothetical protein
MAGSISRDGAAATFDPYAGHPDDARDPRVDCGFRREVAGLVDFQVRDGVEQIARIGVDDGSPAIAISPTQHR